MMVQMFTNSSRPAEMVYASFCGGGSSIVMVAQLNRIGFDCEIDRGYVAVELERLSL
jgi:DNA modification methylase